MARITKRDIDSLKEWRKAYESQDGVFIIGEVVEVENGKRTIITGLRPGEIETDLGVFIPGTVRKADSTKEQLNIYTLFD